MPRQIKLQFGSGQHQQECNLTLQTDSLQELQQAAQAAAPEAFSEVPCQCKLCCGLLHSSRRTCNDAHGYIHAHMQGAIFTNFSQNFTTDDDLSGLKPGETIQLVSRADGGKQLPGKVSATRQQAQLLIPARLGHVVLPRVLLSIMSI